MSSDQELPQLDQHLKMSTNIMLHLDKDLHLEDFFDTSIKVDKNPFNLAIFHFLEKPTNAVIPSKIEK